MDKQLKFFVALMSLRNALIFFLVVELAEPGKVFYKTLLILMFDGPRALSQRLVH